MNVASTTSATAAAAGQNNAAGDSASVDYQAFLKLLVAQMKNQDPTNPMDSTEYVAQLATFSQVEQSIQMNTKLDSILQASALSQSASLIGREIVDQKGQSGIVKEIKLYVDGAVAVLESGQQVPVTPGITVR